MSENDPDIRPVTQGDFDAALRQVLLAKPRGKRGENRQPTKAELETRYRLDRRN